ncbi:hypothetical protein [Chryseobacterium sp. EO14]|uniref:hypothetical protein n=1 Tax=Chryseobacterium sp. EO14 TaxID=2950551 RepID=UPI00210AE3F6|nr:hypothetical protein [Chryseobacterium sp. EO14]MCQ4139526.1 hypothetical protein [Chryseobacterium sp. EO14]
MQNKNLPTEELKKFGIINEDLSFSKKLNADDIQKFLLGYTIVADNDKNRATFQLTENNTKLKVIFLERDKSLSEILKNSKNGVEYSDTFSKYSSKDGKNATQPNWSKTAFIFDKETKKIVEFDFIENVRELTAIIADKKDAVEINRYKNELLKLKNFLQNKIGQYPEITKEITRDLNIVSKEINTVSVISQKQHHSQKQEKSDVQLNVNDPDLYKNAHQVREENEEQKEELQKPRGFRR